MGTVRLGINTCFAIKRCSEPEEWARIIGEELGVREAQFSVDLLDPFVPAEVRTEILSRVSRAAEQYGVNIHSVFTGVGVQAWNLLLHWDEGMREHALNWYKGLADIAAELGVRACGGILGSHTHAQMEDEEEKGRIRTDLADKWRELASHAARRGVEYLMTEPMSVPREVPSGMAETEQTYHALNSDAAIPTYLLLDVGHLQVRSGSAEDRDPYAWIRRFGSRCRAVHLQQTDGLRSHHWPFTEQRNKAGIIEGEKVVEALAESGAEDVVLFLEIFHTNYEPFDNQVVDDLKVSVDYWRQFIP